MQHVFISYASRSRELAIAIANILEPLGARCFVYQRPDGTSAVDADTFTKLKGEIEASSFFVQILEGSAGTRIASMGGTPILQLEMEWFLHQREARGNRRPLPLVLSFTPASDGEERKTFDQYVQWVTDAGIDFVPVDSNNAVFKISVGWFARMRFSPTEISAIEGSLDTDVGRPTVNHAFEQALVFGKPLSQKYLYTSPVAALLWLKLCRYNRTRLSQLYDTIDYRDVSMSSIKEILKQVANSNHTAPLSFIALGCGDARRESILASTIAQLYPHKKVQILLVDVSKTLIAHATQQISQVFGTHNIDPAITFALADFEHPTAMVSLMSRWSRDNPTISILLGNTLGNIESSHFLRTISSAMKPRDILAVEIAIANDAECKMVKEFSNQGWQQASRQKDHDFEFVCGPVRSLGISPQIDRFKMRLEVDATAIHRHFAYQFTKKDMEDIRAVVGDSNYTEAMLELIKVDTFFENKLVDLYPQNLRILSKDIKLCTKIMKEGQAARMGFIVSEKTD